MAQIKELTQGPIPSQIVKLAIPVILTSFIQMSYNLVDMALLGSLGSEVVSGVGTAFYMVWFGRGLVFFTKIGGEVNIAQSIGRGNKQEALHYIRNANTTALIVATLFAIFTYFFATPLIELFDIENPKIITSGVNYLSIVALGMPFTYTNQALTGLYNGIGNTKTPLLVITIGLTINILLDPLFIFGIWIFPEWGVEGAAWATVFSQMVVSLTFMLMLYRKSPFDTRLYFLDFRKLKVHFHYLKNILRVGAPLSLQTMLFSVITMAIAKIVVDVAGGDGRPISVQSIGAQIEALSWMTASGLATALGSFTGQNFGNTNWLRIRKGFYITLKIGLAIGLISSYLFLFHGDFIFDLFISNTEPVIHNLGIVYLAIVSFSQVFMIMEIVSSGAFNGIGKSMPVATTSVVFNLLRIPLALVLSSTFVWLLPTFTHYIPAHYIPITGVWWAFTITSFLKGVILFSLFLFILRKHN